MRGFAPSAPKPSTSDPRPNLCTASGLRCAEEAHGAGEMGSPLSRQKGKSDARCHACAAREGMAGVEAPKGMAGMVGHGRTSKSTHVGRRFHAVAASGPDLANFVKIGTNMIGLNLVLPDTGPKAAQCRSMQARIIGGKRPKFGRSRPRFGQTRPKPGRLRPNPVDVGQNRHNLGQAPAHVWTRPAQI